MTYLGNSPTSQNYAPAVDYFSGNGSTTGFTLSRPVAAVTQVQAIIENVPQNPSTAFTISGNVITFTSAPPAGTNNIYVNYTSPITQVIAPSPGTVQNSSFGTVTAIPMPYGTIGAGNASIMKNRLINGAMVIDQRNAGAAQNPIASGSYPVDRWLYLGSQASKLSAQQNAGSVTPPVGFSNYMGFTSLSAYSIASGDYFAVRQAIEGFNFADLGWGTANAKSVTLSFQVYSSLTGTFGGSFVNSATNRSYPFTYTITNANAWNTISVTIAGDTTGTWVGATNGVGVYVFFGLGVGSTYSGTAGSWAGSYYFSATGATSVVGTNGATFYITGVQLEVGSSATGFEYRMYSQELALCQRYCYVVSNAVANCRIFGFNYSSATGLNRVNFPVQTRVSPTGATVTNPTTFVYYQNNGTGAVSAIAFDAGDVYGANLTITISGGSQAIAANAGSILAANSSGNKIEFTGMEL